MQLANDFAGRKETVVSVSAIVNFSHLYKYLRLNISKNNYSLVEFS